MNTGQGAVSWRQKRYHNVNYQVNVTGYRINAPGGRIHFVGIVKRMQNNTTTAYQLWGSGPPAFDGTASPTIADAR